MLRAWVSPIDYVPPQVDYRDRKEETPNIQHPTPNAQLPDSTLGVESWALKPESQNRARQKQEITQGLPTHEAPLVR
jgi:hypothetical protein